jgi:hypothetical protein
MHDPICFKLFAVIRAADVRTFWMAGNSKLTRIAMMAMTTKSSMRVKPNLRMAKPRVIDNSLARATSVYQRFSVALTLQPLSQSL